MANKPPKQKRERHPLDRIPTRKLAAAVRKQLVGKIERNNPDWKSGKPKKD